MTTKPQDETPTKKLVNPTVLTSKVTKTENCFGHAKELALLLEMYQAQSKSGSEEPMIKIVARELNELQIPFNTDKYGQMYRLVPKTPLLCAHLDQVGTKQLTMLYIGNNVIAGDANLGADDKNGCWMMLQLIKRYKGAVSFLFTTNEERGGNIASFLTSRKDEMSKLLYALVFDRRNNTDIIGTQNDYCSLEFEQTLEALSIVQETGFKATKGLSGDSNKLRALLSTVNLSCGYFEPHSAQEYTEISGLLNALQFSNAIIRNVTKKFKPYVAPVTASNYRTPTNGTQTSFNRKKGMPKYTTLGSVPIAQRQNHAYCLARLGFVKKEAAISKKTCKTCSLKKFKDENQPTTYAVKRCRKCLEPSGKEKLVMHHDWVAKADIKRSCTFCIDEKLAENQIPCKQCLKDDIRPWWHGWQDYKFTKDRPSSKDLQQLHCGKCKHVSCKCTEEPCKTCATSIKPIHPSFTPATPEKGDSMGKQIAANRQYKTITHDCITCRSGQVLTQTNAVTCMKCADVQFADGFFPQWVLAEPKHFLDSNGCLHKNVCLTCNFQIGEDDDADAISKRKCTTCKKNYQRPRHIAGMDNWLENNDLLTHIKGFQEEIDGEEEEDEPLLTLEHVCPSCYSNDLTSEDSGNVVCNTCLDNHAFADLDEIEGVLQ